MKTKLYKKHKVSYEPEADVMSWEVSTQPIDYAEEAGDFIVHYTKNHKPVLVEILQASRFFDQSMKMISADRMSELSLSTK